MHSSRLAFTICGILSLYGAAAAQSVESSKAGSGLLTLTATEKGAVNNCLSIIRECQLPDGAIVQLSRGSKVGSPVWIAPYFANHAALALLSDHERTKTVADLGRVGKWLSWCAKNQADDGYWNDFEGTGITYRNNDKVDAWDSSAALFLLVVGRFQKAGGRVTPDVLTAAKKSLKCIESVCDADGLTWATPTYKVKYLMDNVEVYGGLKASVTLFNSMGAKDAAEKATSLATSIGKKLPDYWIPANNLFAYALLEDGKFEHGLTEAYPHGLAQLFGVAFISPRASAFSAARKFPPDVGLTAAAGTERWLVAASRLGSKEAKEWREKLVKESNAFTTRNVYVHRPAVAALALLEGANWLPGIAGTK